MKAGLTFVNSLSAELSGTVQSLGLPYLLDHLATRQLGIDSLCHSFYEPAIDWNVRPKYDSSATPDVAKAR